ncbi:GntR family transcriptional regulator [Belnapia sp. T6]|uniref:GntR family transcriptional regulator n=1 Tax=Belnapia mucosa TaxID=2804532 RepID=A0ABS1V7N1_9PROT|nr:GntR family transcriptional regulator [Belnapia mucosa]MBL6457676.1 GntR family transcriptional regulator [Belnapia mucosa]
MTGRTPRYQEIASALLAEIRAGRWAVGDRLPIETELSERFEAGRHTVREALRILTQQGLILRRAGLGSVVVAAEPPAVFTHSVGSLAEWMRYPPETFRETLHGGEVTADRALAGVLKCPPGRRWFHIASIRRADAHAQPLGWTDIYVLPKYAAVIRRRDHGRTPVHEQIARQFGEAIDHARLDVFAGRLPPEMAGPLEAEPGCPTLVMVRRYFGLRSGLFEITVTTHPEGRYVYSMDMRRELRVAPA